MYEEAIVLQDVHERLHDRPRVQTTVRACLDGAYLQLRQRGTGSGNRRGRVHAEAAAVARRSKPWKRCMSTGLRT